MKRILLVVCAFLALNASAQQEMDARILQNKGAQAEKAFRYNKNSYNYYLFELDSSYTLVNTADLSKEERKLVVKHNSIPVEDHAKIGTDQFNLFSYGIQLSSTTRQYFAIGKDKVLMVYSIPEITAAFTKSPLNTK